MTGATAGVATLPSSRRRRDSSEDFGAAGSLGSIGGSEVGSSVHSESGQVVAAATPTTATPTTIVATAATIPTTASVTVAVAATIPHTTSQHDSLFTTPAKAAPSTASKAKAEAASSSSPGSEDRKSMPAPPPVAFITTPKKVPPLGATTTQQQQQPQEKTPQVKNTSASKSKKSNLKSEGTISDEHRPFRKRKNSVDFDLDESRHHQYPVTNLSKQTTEALPSVDALPFDDLSSSHKAGRSDSFASFGGSSSSVTRLRSDTLERLDALGEEAKLAAAKIRTTRKDSQATTSSSGGGSQHTLTSTTHRLLLQAFMGGADHEDEDDDDDEMVGDADDDEIDAAMAAAEGNGGDDESLVDSHAAEQAETQEMTRENNERRDRLGSFDVARERLGSFDVRERLGSFDARDRLGSFDVRDRLGSFDVRDRADSFGGRERLGSFDGTTTHVPSYETLRRRERLESWGGMSDLSIPQVPDSTGDSLIGIGSGAGGGGSAGGNTNSTSALAAAVYTSLANDLSAAANIDGEESINDFFVDNENVPSKISTTRDRLDSVNSAATDPSITQLPTEEQIPSDIQKFVKQAMASVGDQLAGIAMAATEATKDLEDQSELSSTASPMIGAVADAAAKSIYQSRSKLNVGMDIAVDYSAVQAAVNAAEAAAGAIDLTVFAQSASASVASNSSSTINKKPAAAGGTKRKRTTLPTKKSKTPKTPTSTTKKIPKDAAKAGATKAAKASSKAVPKTATKGTPVVVKATPKPPIELPPIPKSKMDERDMELLRERARAAAGYVPPSKQPGGRPPVPPPKKRKIEPQTPHVRNVPTLYTTPRTIYSDKKVISTPYTPGSSYMSTPGSAKSTASKGQSTQKWDAMYECLLEFVEERRAESTKGMTEAEKKEWIWDGNVPTTHKTKDGKALGRWVNNQRSAKSKGALKDEREKRLVDAGLKWSVLASNSWNEMLAELRIYVNEQIKAGRKWDGNVPTNYRIKTKPGMAARDDDEDKNLGRWVNRQRSLYQAGKLRKERQLALEKVGLKWSMLATTSWESMFDTLVEYVQEKTKDGSEWDGNVPANYRTSDTPPRALGRWINRQRSAYGKDKIKKEYVDKLNKMGLKWSVHERRLGSYPDTPSSAVVVSAPTSRNDDEATRSNFPTQNGGQEMGETNSTVNNESDGASCVGGSSLAESKEEEEKKSSEPPPSAEGTSASTSN